MQVGMEAGMEFLMEIEDSFRHLSRRCSLPVPEVGSYWIGFIENRANVEMAEIS